MSRKPAPELSAEELDQHRQRMRKLSNSGRYAEAYSLACRLKKKYPRTILFAYYEAVYTAEDDVGFTPAQVNARYRLAAKKLKALLLRSRAMSPTLLDSAKNEYYWFSRQPKKQYQLGLNRVKAGDKFAHYSAGVGAVMVAKKYALEGRLGLCERWAKKSEKAWLAYFKVMPKWFNSYVFYATALGYQGKLKEMDAAFAKGTRIAGRPKGWKVMAHYRQEALDVIKVIERLRK